MTTPTAPRKRRSCLNTCFLSGLGCTAFVAGAVAILVLLLPRIVASFLPGWIERGFADAFEGSLSVGSVELAWSGRQSVSDVVVLDPEGGEVLRTTIAAPSLLDLLDRDQTLLFQVDLAAELVADDAGVTNLERALRPRPGTRVQTGEDRGTSGEDELEQFLEHLDARLELRGRRISWSDAETRARGAPLELRGLELDAEARPGEPKTASLRATLAAAEPGEIEARMSIAGPLQGAHGWPFQSLDAQVNARGLSVAMVDGLCGLRGDLVTVLDPRVDLELALRDLRPGSGEVSLALRGAEARADGLARLEGGVLRIDEQHPLTMALGVPAERLAELAQRWLPAGAELVPGDVHGRATVEASGLVLPLDALRDAARAGGLAGVARALGTARGHVVVELPAGFYYLDERARASGTILGFTTAHLELRAAEGERVSCSLYAALDTGEPGDAQLDVELGTAPGDAPLAALDLQVRQVSSAALDGYLGLGGCLAEAVGSALGARARLEDLGSESGSVLALVRSTGFSCTLQGPVKEGRLVLEPEHGLVVSLRPPPGWFERCVAPKGGWSVSLLVAEGEDLRLATDGGALPMPAEPTGAALAAALRECAAKARLELGTWQLSRARADGSMQSIGVERVRADVALAEDGRLELALAAGLDTGRPGSLSVRAVVPDARELLDGGAASGIEVDVAAQGVSAELVRELAAPYLPEGASLAIDAEGTIGLRWTGGLEPRAATPVSGDATLSLPELRYAQADGLALGLTQVEAKAGLAQDEVHAELAGDVGEGLLRDVLGERLHLAVRLAGPKATSGEGELAAVLAGTRLSGGLAATLAEGGLSSAEGSGLELAWLPDEAALGRLLGASLPAGASLAPAREGAATLKLTGLRFSQKAASGGAGGARAPSTAVAELEGALELALPDLVYRAPGGAAPIELRGVRVTSALRPGELAALTLEGEVAGGDPPETGPLRASVRALDPLALLGEPDGRQRFRVAFDVHAQGLPTALVDALAGQKGLLVEAFGPRLDVDAKSDALSRSQGSFRAEARSQRSALSASGAIRDGVLTASGEDGLDAKVRVGPLVSQRLLGSLVPLFVDVRKPEGAAPAALRVSDVSMPIDGDLSRLDARVTLELGEVLYRVLPGLESSFLGGLLEERARTVAPIHVRIERGVARYDGLPLAIRGHDVEFKGSYGLVDGRLALDADVPLEVLGESALKRLDKVRRYLGPNTVVPIEVRGTPRRPEIRLGDEFVERALKDAGRNLLDRLLKDD